MCCLGKVEIKFTLQASTELTAPVPQYTRVVFLQQVDDAISEYGRISVAVLDEGQIVDEYRSAVGYENM